MSKATTHGCIWKSWLSSWVMQEGQEGPGCKIDLCLSQATCLVDRREGTGAQDGLILRCKGRRDVRDLLGKLCLAIPSVNQPPSPPPKTRCAKIPTNLPPSCPFFCDQGLSASIVFARESK